MSRDSAALNKAKNYAFLLLKFRLRSEREIQERLKDKKFDGDIIKETLSFLKDKGYIDDNNFAQTWIQSRIKKPLGLKRLREELQIKGIACAIIDSQIERIKKDYPEEKIVFELAKEKLKKIKSVQLNKAKQRTFNYLLHRGFSPDVIIEVLNQI